MEFEFEHKVVLMLFGILKHKGIKFAISLTMPTSKTEHWCANREIPNILFAIHLLGGYFFILHTHDTRTLILHK